MLLDRQHLNISFFGDYLDSWDLQLKQLVQYRYTNRSDP